MEESWQDKQERYNAGLSDEILVINYLAKKHGYSRAVIKDAVQTPFAFLNNKMKDFEKGDDGPLPVFKIRGFGSIMPKWRHSLKFFNNGN